jgi:fatty-acyl-CoA synthase
MFIPLLATDFLDKSMRQFGGKTGVVDGALRLTYGEFGERVNRLSNALRAMGIQKGDRVAVVDANSHRLLELHFGVPRIGAILLPINIRLSPKEIAYVLNDAGACCLFVNREMTGLIDDGQLTSVERTVLMGTGVPGAALPAGEDYEACLARSSSAIEEDFGVDENDPAEMFYTSGTSGRPKGMLLSHRMLWLAATKDLFLGTVNDRTVYLHAIPLFHANCWRKAHTITAVGGRHVMLPQFRADLVCRLIEQEKVTYIEMVPTMADTLTQFADLAGYDLSSLQGITIGGAPLLKATQDALEDKFSWCRINAGYGMSETSSCATTAYLKGYLEDRLPETEKKRMRRSQGYEDMLTRVRVVDADGRDVAADNQEIGEIILRGHTVIDSYWKLPKETKNTIVDGWLYSGDVATIDAHGYVTIVDRKKDIIISGGENIGSLEVENAIAAHPDVLEVAVVAAPHEKWGETPAAFIVLRSGSDLTSETLIDFCRKQELAGFKIPRRIAFVPELPKGGTGKILKSELKRSLWPKAS